MTQITVTVLVSVPIWLRCTVNVTHQFNYGILASSSYRALTENVSEFVSDSWKHDVFFICKLLLKSSLWK